MATPSTDRRVGVNAGLALKAPVRASTTANITLSGEQTLDGVAMLAGDRVLVKNQANSIENGIYDVSTGAWTRSLDFNGTRDVITGTRVFINEGTTLAGLIYSVATTGAIAPGTTPISFQLSVADVPNFIRVLNLAALRTSEIGSSQKYWVDSHTTAGDGGEGQFRYTSGGAYVDNDGTVIVPTGGDGSAAFLREFVGKVFATWFGAIADFNDATAPANTIAIQAAIDSGGAGSVLAPIDVDVPFGCRFNLTSLTYPNNLNLFYSSTDDLTRVGYGGRSNERHVLSNRAFTDGTDVNEFVHEAPHHPALTLDIRQDLQKVGTIPNNEFASVVVRKEGFTKWQIGRYTNDSFGVQQYTQYRTIDVGSADFSKDSLYVGGLIRASVAAVNDEPIWWGIITSVAAGTVTLAWQHGLGSVPQTGTIAYAEAGEVAMTGITLANPAVVTTAAAHGYTSGNYVTIREVIGTTQVNLKRYQITVTDSTHFSLNGIDSTAYTAYSSAGFVTRDIDCDNVFTTVTSADGTRNNRIVVRGNGKLGAGANLPENRAAYSWTVGGAIAAENANVDGSSSSYGSSAAALLLADNLKSPAAQISIIIDAATNRANISRTNGTVFGYFDLANGRFFSDVVSSSQFVNAQYIMLGALSGSSQTITPGTGSPEGVLTAVKGATFHRLDGGAASCFYVKETATGNTGWVAK
jgi:hypothetical protein